MIKNKTTESVAVLYKTALSITCILWLPPHTLRLGFSEIPSANQISEQCGSETLDMSYNSSYEAAFSNITNFLRSSYFRQSSYNVAMINQGLWPYDRSNEVLSEYYAALKGISHRVIWKTTTQRVNEAAPVDDPEFMQRLSKDHHFEIFDGYNMTSKYFEKHQMYTDDKHFQNNVYTELNLKLLNEIFNCEQ